MSITVTNDKIFHLQTPGTSYIIAILDDKYAAHVYWGKKIPTPDMDNALLKRWMVFSANEEDKGYTLDFIRQEYPVGCGTDFRSPAISVVYNDGSRTAQLHYENYRIASGKPSIPGLPSTYVESDCEADTLEIFLRDPVKGLKVTLRYTAYNNIDVITRNAIITNGGEAPVIIEKALSASVDFEHSDFEMITLTGAWARERHIERGALRSGVQSVESRRGASSHQANPFLALTAKNATEDYGDVYGFNLVYSGNFSAGAEVDQIFRARAWIGINDYDFAWTLDCGDSFHTPEAVMVYSSKGIGEMSRTYHRLYRKRLVRGKYRDEPRPILANNWEATYFDFTEEKIINLAKEAAGLGIELLVLDDGWFGRRNDDTSSLGDWYVNTDKLPGGIAQLAQRVNEQGVKFGLWFEPEMVSPDSDLYRAHPDWCIHVPERPRTRCRNQLTLDLSRPEVCDYVVKAVSDVLDSANISYVKWDMNRHMTNLGSAGLPAERQKEMAHRYMLGLYDVMERVTSSHPDVLFESCSGGGGRFDPGILHYMPQTWTSDNTDALDRLFIQYGTSLAYPVSAMGAHVSAVPNHQVGRVTSLKMRGDVAMCGNFGYELDLTSFADEEKAQVREQVALYKELRTFVQAADMYRVANPFDGNAAAWVFVSEDGRNVFAAYFRLLARVNGPVQRMKFAGLDEAARYEVVGEGKVYTGAELMNIGLDTELHGDFQSITWRLKKLG